MHDWAHVIGLGLWIPLFAAHVVIPLFDAYVAFPLFVATPVYRQVLLPREDFFLLVLSFIQFCSISVRDVEICENRTENIGQPPPCHAPFLD